jgi:ketosteroid isomerase-like protein
MVLGNDDGSLRSKTAFLASVDAAMSSDEQQAEPESISVHLFGDVAIATGGFREKGIENGKPYVKRNRFVDTGINKNGSWMCIAASATPVLPQQASTRWVPDELLGLEDLPYSFNPVGIACQLV